jgi:hypothetical protein
MGSQDEQPISLNWKRKNHNKYLWMFCVRAGDAQNANLLYRSHASNMRSHLNSSGEQSDSKNIEEAFEHD